MLTECLYLPEAKYFKAQIAEELQALGTAEPPVRSRL